METLQFQELIQNRLGLYFGAGKETDLERHVKSAMTEAKITDTRLYFSRLYNETEDSDLWLQLARYLTVGETYFFRDSAQMDALRNHILPRLIQQRRNEHYPTLRLWSAGCSSGEEPYSLAILLRQLLPDIAQWNIIILGTDINLESLAYASKGIYTKNSFRNETPADLRDSYFRPAEKGGYEILPEIRRMVRFNYLNLVSDLYPAASNFTNNLDLIICRNVTIYFQPETTTRIVEKFYRGLLPDGWLVVGHSEPMARIYQGFGARNFQGAVVYQKENQASLPPKLSEPAPIFSSPPISAEPLPTFKNHSEKPVASAREYYEKGKACADQMKWSEAHTWLTRALTMNPLFIEAHYIRALVYMHEGDYDAAIEGLERTLYIDRNFILAYFNIGLIQRQRNNLKEARRAWRIADELLQRLSPDIVLPYSDGMAAGYVMSLLKTYLSEGEQHV